MKKQRLFKSAFCSLALAAACLASAPGGATAIQQMKGACGQGSSVWCGEDTVKIGVGIFSVEYKIDRFYDMLDCVGLYCPI